MTKDAPEGTLRPQLWVERGIDETVSIYTDWAATYDKEVTGRGYQTPRRLAEALAPHLPNDDRPVLDFGCGTGLGGMALRSVGISPLHGTDITEAMIQEARPRDIYEQLWVGQPGVLDIAPGTYRAVVAVGVISLGAAPPETLDLLVDALGAGDMLALSFNGPTLEHGGYDAALTRHIDANRLETVFRENGPHLDDIGMKSDVIVLRRL